MAKHASWNLKRARAGLDASFLKAWSIRNPANNQIGLSDPDARVGRNWRSYGLGYKLHTSVEPRRILPLASVLEPANEKRQKSKRAPRTLCELYFIFPYLLGVN
jgi:hypothetical protein